VMKKLILGAAFILGACAILAIIGGAMGGGKASPASRPAAVANAPATRCEPASVAQLAAIRSGVKGVEPANDVRIGFAVKSSDYKNVSFVAAKIYGPGMASGTGPGVWAMDGTRDAPVGVFSVGGFAIQFSDWADGGKIKTQMSSNDDGWHEAEQCAR
jgi:hypothetical protein